MNKENSEVLARLKDLIRSPSAEAWLEGARAETAADGRSVLHVRGEFPKQMLENRYRAEVRKAFGGRVDILSDHAARARRRSKPMIRPQLFGPKGEYAVRMVRAFVEGGPLSTPLVVIHGPPRSGKSALVEWAGSLAGRGRVFLLDLRRVRAGRSRLLVPRKPLVIADGVEVLSQAMGAQRTLIRILDHLRDRGDRALVTVEGHPRETKGLHGALVNRLEGGVLVPLEKPGTASLRRQLRDQARGMGRLLPRAWEEELVELPHEDAIEALRVRLEGSASQGTSDRDRIEAMKDVAARLLEIERERLDGGCRRRSTVEARRVVMVAARRAGIADGEITAAFGFSTLRPVREALRVIEREEARDRGFAAVVSEVGRAGS